MEETLMKVLPAGGSLAGIIVVVLLFLKHLRAAESRAQAASASATELLAQTTAKIAAEARAEREMLGHRLDVVVDKMFEKHTNALTLNTEALSRLCRNCEDTRKFLQERG